MTGIMENGKKNIKAFPIFSKQNAPDEEVTGTGYISQRFG